MPQKMNVWAKLERKRMIARLGGVCVDCKPDEGLVISHKIPLSPEESEARARMGMAHRIVLYRRQEAKGQITVRCQSCNIKQSKEPKQGFLTLPAYATTTNPPV